MMANQALDNGLAALKFARQNTLGLLEDLPADKLTHQPFPGCNHALWNAGHLAVTDDLFLTVLGKRPGTLPDKWGSLFGMGSKPTPKPSDYPPFSEIRQALVELGEQVQGWFRSMNQSQLDQPLPEDWRTFAANHGMLMGSIAWHEGLHAGQITVIRKSLGLGPKFA